MNLEDIIKHIEGYTKAFVKVFLDHEYSHMKFIDKENIYSNEMDNSRDHALNNIYKNNLNKKKNYDNE